MITAFLLTLLLAVPQHADGWRIVQLDKVITMADRTTYLVPPAGKTWLISPGSFNTDPLPGKHLTAFLTTLPRNDDLLIVIGIWDLKDGNAQLPEVTIRSGYQLVLYVNGVDEGEILDTWVRLGIVERDAE